MAMGEKKHLLVMPDAEDGCAGRERLQTHHQRPRAAEATLRTTPWKRELASDDVFCCSFRRLNKLRDAEEEDDDKRRDSEDASKNRGSSCGSEVLEEKDRGGGSGSARPAASEKRKKATAFFFSLSPLIRVCATMKLSRNRDGWVQRPMVGQVPVQAGLCTHENAVLQGSAGFKRDTHTQHTNIEHAAAAVAVQYATRLCLCWALICVFVFSVCKEPWRPAGNAPRHRYPVHAAKSGHMLLLSSLQLLPIGFVLQSTARSGIVAF
ncbi:hypothetical protein ACQKWADRAFT_168124 [Trichoderma austrokoningii]